MDRVPDFPPPAGDPATAPFWDATKQGALRLPACPVCHEWQWYPLGGLPCHPDQSLEWRIVQGLGTIFTFTRVERAFLPSGGEPPYTIALVELDDAPGHRLVTVLVGPGCERPAIGDRVCLAPTVLPTHTLPTFSIAA